MCSYCSVNLTTFICCVVVMIVIFQFINNNVGAVDVRKLLHACHDVSMVMQNGARVHVNS